MKAALERADEISQNLGPTGGGIEGARRRYLKAREWWNEGAPEIDPILDETVPGPFGAARLRLFYPKTEKRPLPAFVFAHGGGYRISGCGTDDRLMSEIVSAWGGMAISADYVHMPKHIFPDAVEETAELYAWLSENGGRWGIDGERLAFGGASAGTNLALGAALHLGGTECAYLKAGVMFSADLDHEPNSSSMDEFGKGDIFPTRQTIIEAHKTYAGDPANEKDMRLNCTLERFMIYRNRV